MNLMCGYYRLNFDCLSLLGPTKWALERGSEKKYGVNRGVDILLATPERRNVGVVKSVQILLGMHSISGVWMIHTQYFMTIDGVNISPVEGAGIPLTKPRALICAGDMHYYLDFKVKTQSLDEAYIHRRNRLLEHHSTVLPRTPISGIPLHCDIHLDLAVYRLGISQGTFSTVYEGLDPQSGDLRVVKRLVIRSEEQRKIVQDEIKALESCTGSQGIVKLFGVRNSIGGPSKKGGLPLDLFIVLEKGQAFGLINWQVTKSETWPALSQQLLQGLHTVHSRGWIHGDISVNNILELQSDLPGAVICDFGKVSFSPTSTNPHIGGATYRAPEIMPDRSVRYDQRVDIWMLGWALAMSFFKPFIISHNINNQIGGIESLRKELHSRRAHCPLAGLLREMLSVNPEDRPYAAKCLTHPCFTSLHNASHTEGPPRKK